MKRKKLLLIPAVILLFVLALPPFLRWQNDGLTVTRYVYRSAEVDEALDGYVIVQLSDLQDKCFGTDQEPLLKKVAALKPDLIVLTGDMVDFHRFTMEPTLALMRGVVEIAPSFFVSGNHEGAFTSEEQYQILKQIAACGVTVLNDCPAWIEYGEAHFCLFGLQDWAVLPKFWDANVPQEEGLCILLAHRPERFEQYAQANVDLVLSGHAHGGQIRLPFVGGLYSTDQGFFPKLSEGMHKKNGVTMIINRGLGNSEFSQRLFNRPEIVQITLRHGK